MGFTTLWTKPAARKREASKSTIFTLRQLVFVFGSRFLIPIYVWQIQVPPYIICIFSVTCTIELTIILYSFRTFVLFSGRNYA